jgi:hypothetical protein
MHVEQGNLYHGGWLSEPDYVENADLFYGTTALHPRDLHWFHTDNQLTGNLTAATQHRLLCTSLR